MGTWIRDAGTRARSCAASGSGGGGKRDRTADLLHAMQALSQLSYTPTANMKLYGARPLVQTAQHFDGAAARIAVGYDRGPPRRSDRAVAARCRCPPPTAPSPSDLAGRVVLVTGAAGGLGAPLALACAARGATVVLHGRVVRKLEALYDEIVAAGASRSRRSCRSISPRRRRTISATSRARLEAQLGRLDGIVHTAAMLGSLGPIEHQSFDAWQTVLRVNLAAPMGVDARAAAAAFAGAGRVASCSRSTTRGEAAARVLGRLRRRPRPGSSALARDARRRVGEPPEPARQRRRARTDPLAAARADASGRGPRRRCRCPTRWCRSTFI